MKRFVAIFCVEFCLVFWSWGGSGVLLDVASRLQPLGKSVPAVVASAADAADRMWSHRKAAIIFPTADCVGFREEMWGRAGGLAHLSGRHPRSADLMLVAVRDWERQSERMAQLVEDCRTSGVSLVMFGSQVGKPGNVHPDHFIDNGAPSGSKEHGPVNAIANAILGWMWCCEYVAAHSRGGRCPAILKSIASDDSWVLNTGNETTDKLPCYLPCDEAIPAGELARAYLLRVRKLLADAAEPHVISAIDDAATIIAERLAAGGRVGIAGLGHLILEETKHDIKSPMLGFRAVSMMPHAFSEVLERGDILVWITYAGMNSAWDDYGKHIHDAGLEVISSYGRAYEAESPTGHLAHIPQVWSLPDAEIGIPVAPYAMAPVSAINRLLILRMLDEAVAERLAAGGKSIQRRNIAEPYVFYDRFASRLNLYSLASATASPADRIFDFDLSGGLIAQSGWSEVKHNASDDASGILQAADGKSYWDRGYGGQKRRIVQRDWKWGLLDSAGGVVIEPKFDIVRHAGGANLIVGLGGKFGLVSSLDGQTLIDAKFDALSPCGTNFAFATGLRWGLVAPSGKILIQAHYDPVLCAVGSGMVRAGLGGRVGLFKETGEEILPPIYDQIGAIRGDEVLARRDFLWSVKSLSGGKIALTNQLDRIEFLPSGGYWAVHCGKHGVFNPDGSTLIPLEYDVLFRHARRQNFIGRKVDGWFLLDFNGQAQPFPVDCDYVNFAEADYVQSALPSGLYRIAQKMRFGVASADGKVVVPMKYSYIYPFDSDGYARVATGGVWRLDAHALPMLYGAKYGVINSEGSLIIQPDYDAVQRVHGGFRAISVARPLIEVP